jgi:hypothetical protein
MVPRSGPQNEDGATVDLQVGTVTHALSVPTSAIQQGTSSTTVSLYSGGSVTTQTVTTGIAGLDRTQITSGLTAGQQVVLANVSEPVPSSTLNTRLGRFIGGAGLGGLGGGGLGGGAGLTRRSVGG